MKKLQLLVASVIKSGKELLRKKAVTSVDICDDITDAENSFVCNLL